MASNAAGSERKNVTAEIWNELDRDVCAKILELARVPEALANQPWDRIGAKYQERISTAWKIHQANK